MCERRGLCGSQRLCKAEVVHHVPHPRLAHRAQIDQHVGAPSGARAIARMIATLDQDGLMPQHREHSGQHAVVVAVKGKVPTASADLEREMPVDREQGRWPKDAGRRS